MSDEINTIPENEEVVEIKPITLTYRNRMWNIDFSRRAIQRITKDPELAKALDMDENCGMVTRIARWSYAIPSVISIASGMPLATAEDAFGEMSNPVDFSVRVSQLYIDRVTKIMGIGEADAEASDQGNVKWE